MPILAIFAALLCIAAWHDVHDRRIPNIVVMVGLALGLIIQAATSSGSGFFHPNHAGALGITASAIGALTGLFLFMPFYALRTLGAGDVKLLAMVGAWLGPTGVAWTALWSMVAGGLLSIVVMLACGHTRSVVLNLRSMFFASTLAANDPSRASGGTLGATARVTTGRLPYALAIAAGSAFEVGRHWL